MEQKEIPGVNRWFFFFFFNEISGGLASSLPRLTSFQAQKAIWQPERPWSKLLPWAAWNIGAQHGTREHRLRRCHRLHLLSSQLDLCWHRAPAANGKITAGRTTLKTNSNWALGQPVGSPDTAGYQLAPRAVQGHHNERSCCSSSSSRYPSQA